MENSVIKPVGEIAAFIGKMASSARPVVNINGTGGKTSLMWMLAQTFRGCKALASTTTHIAIPEKSFYDYFLDSSVLKEMGGQGLEARIGRGVTLAIEGGEGWGKSLPIDILEGIIPLFDYVFLEGDGSRTLPLKGWADYEPVFTKHTNITVGVLPLWTMGMKISEKIVHRLPLFLSLTGASEGETLKPEHYVRVITGKKGQEGLFKGAMGAKILLFNQIEDERAFSAVREIVNMLPPDFAAGLAMIAAGSVLKETRQQSAIRG